MPLTKYQAGNFKGNKKKKKNLFFCTESQFMTAELGIPLWFTTVSHCCKKQAIKKYSLVDHRCMVEI